jgi:hypothetical protein
VDDAKQKCAVYAMGNGMVPGSAQKMKKLINFLRQQKMPGGNDVTVVGQW